MRRTNITKKILAYGALFVCTFVSLTACGDKKSENEIEPITFTFYNCDGSEDPWTDPVALEITKATGVSLETSYPSNEQDSSIILMIATGELPD